MDKTSSEILSSVLGRLDRSRMDNLAWQTLYKRLWPLMVGTNYRILRGHRDLAEDASQEVFLRIFQYVQFKNFVGKPDDFTRYVRAMCRNVSLTYMSKLLREPSFFQEELKNDSGGDGRSRWSDPERELVKRGEISRFLADLDPRDQKLLALLASGATIAEIAEQLGLTYSNAAVRIHRLRNVLHKSLKTEEIKNHQEL